MEKFSICTAFVEVPLVHSKIISFDLQNADRDHFHCSVQHVFSFLSWLKVGQSWANLCNEGSTMFLVCFLTQH